MQNILYIENDYCTCFEDLIKYFERGVQDIKIRNEILGYYRDGVLSEWMRGNGGGIPLDVMDSCDNDLYDKLYMEFTGKTSVINSLSSNFTEFVKLEDVKYSSDGKNFESYNNNARDIKSIILCFRVLKPNNNEFSLKVVANNITRKVTLNLNDYKKNQQKEIHLEFDTFCTEGIKIIEGENNLIYSMALNKFDLNRISKAFNYMFKTFKPQSDNADFYYSKLKNYPFFIDDFTRDEQKLVYHAAESLALLTHYSFYQRNVSTLQTYELTLGRSLISKLDCIRCLKGIFYFLTTRGNIGIADEIFENSINCPYSIQMLNLRELPAYNQSSKLFKPESMPTVDNLKLFLEWYFEQLSL